MVYSGLVQDFHIMLITCLESITRRMHNQQDVMFSMVYIYNTKTVRFNNGALWTE